VSERRMMMMMMMSSRSRASWKTRWNSPFISSYWAWQGVERIWGAGERERERERSKRARKRQINSPVCDKFALYLSLSCHSLAKW